MAEGMALIAHGDFSWFLMPNFQGKNLNLGGKSEIIIIKKINKYKRIKEIRNKKGEGHFSMTS